PIEGVEIKLSASGELLVRSPGLLKGYYKNEAATAEALTADGWFHTGDAGFLTAGGHLKIIDRAKDVGRLHVPGAARTTAPCLRPSTSRTS
ncbi:AMP-binding protein, partial [Klebsiella pneumoniae]